MSRTHRKHASMDQLKKRGGRGLRTKDEFPKSPKQRRVSERAKLRKEQ